jgi:Methyltransferase domain
MTNDFETRLAALDTVLFQHVLSQMPEEDRKSLLALEEAVRARHRQFVYLEIGSYLGGSLQPFVVDPCCQKIISLDPRLNEYADSRGLHPYAENTTAKMLESLGKIPGADLSKIQSIEAGTDTVKQEAIQPTPHFCFIDGEHTDAAVLRDARFCLSVVNPDGCIAFHDANLIYGALDTFIKELNQSGRSFRPYVLPETIFVIDLGAANYGAVEPVSSRRADNYKAYLGSLMRNDGYRYAYNLPVYRFLRKIRRLFPRF